MNRDPLYHKIVKALEGPLDGNLFQSCAVAIIGKAHPNLAPMPGGNDAGMDGAFGTPEGPFPLICTVQSDVLGNFRRNISTYLAKGNVPKVAVIATSQAISNRRKRNLEKAASELHVKIANIYDAPYFANELYRDSKWRLELLGVTGDIPALSALPRVGRYGQSGMLIGRGEDVAWLLQRLQDDALVVGQPGSGKTYLHQYLARQGHCLFAIDRSSTRLAEAIREQQPSVIVVDDAHVNLELVEDLRRLRAEHGVGYSIHLNCWPRREAEVQRILDIPQSCTRRLQRLRKAQILELIKERGIHGPDWLHELLISQSDGKPGLAVALTEHCQTQDVRQIWSGEAAAQHLLGNWRVVRSERDRCVLAAFAVGGDSGMSFNQVSVALQLTNLELRRITADLGAGGLIEEMAEDRLQVRPPDIRAVLVRDVFYGGPSSLPIHSLLEGTYSVPSTASVLLSARQRGAKIDHGLLERFVIEANSRDIWEHFAWVDCQCADVVLSKHPEAVCHAATGLLHHSPNRALQALLDADELNVVKQLGAVEHPRRRISEWLFPYDETSDVTVDRRLMLLDVLEDRVRKGKIGNGESLGWALAELFQAVFDVTKSVPGDNRQIRCIRGLAPPAALNSIAALWPRVKALLLYVPSVTIRILFDRLESWCIPQRLSLVSPMSDNVCEMVREHGRRMLTDLLEMPQCTRAWRTRAATVAKWGGVNIEPRIDPVFDALYADRNMTTDWEKDYNGRVVELQGFADTLLTQPIAEALESLADIQREATEFGFQAGRSYLWVVYRRIAERCEEPNGWLDALVCRNMLPDFVVPFVDRLLTSDVERYQVVLRDLLEYPQFRPLAINRVLLMDPPKATLLSSALAVLDDGMLVASLYLQDTRIPLAAMLQLLCHPNALVRAAAAIAEWQREPRGVVRADLESEWKVALCDVEPSHYALHEIFEKRPLLAFDWLASQVQSGKRYLSFADHAFRMAANLLNETQRSQALRMFTRDNYSDNCFDVILGEHIELFAAWLRQQKDEYVRFKPLDRDFSPRWERMAVLALDAGVSPDELAEHCSSNIWEEIEPNAPQFVALVSAYEALANHADPRLRPAGKRGLRILQSRAECERQRHYREEWSGY